MSLRTTAALSIASVFLTQLPRTSAQQTAAASQPPATTVVVPTGTLVPLNLVNPIKHKSSKPGDTVRATVAFPITVGDQIAIPAGTTVEGTIAAPAKGKKPANQPPVVVHFTKLIYANGYTVTLDATNTAALTAPPLAALPSGVELAQLERPRLHGPAADPDPEPLYAPEPQTTTPTLPPLPHLGPSVGEVVAISVTPFAALIGTLIILKANHAHSDYIVEDAGWQFQLTLQSPLPVDVARVNAAAATAAP
jgi:hypothetical protein